MNEKTINFTYQELRELDDLVEEYRRCPGDDSFFHHLAWFLIDKLVEERIIEKL